jgi:uncharacterized membrane protein YphA (DoxX/SURF4 family)
LSSVLVKPEYDQIMENKENNNVWIKIFGSLVVLMRVLFGVGWFLAGITKITGKGWFSEPGVFLQDYLIDALDKPNVPEFYKYFIEHEALNHIMFLNYTIPISQMILGTFVTLGFMTLPSVLIILFMHVNFILSGNMNLISLTLYTSGFGIILCIKHVYILSLDRFFKFKYVFTLNSIYKNTRNLTKTVLPKDELNKLLEARFNEILKSIENIEASQNKKIEQLITCVQEIMTNSGINQEVDLKKLLLQGVNEIAGTDEKIQATEKESTEKLNNNSQENDVHKHKQTVS